MNRFPQFWQFYFILLGFFIVLLQLSWKTNTFIRSWPRHAYLGPQSCVGTPQVIWSLLISLWVDFAGNTCSSTVGFSIPAVCGHAHSLWLHHHITAGLCVWYCHQSAFGVYVVFFYLTAIFKFFSCQQFILKCTSVYQALKFCISIHDMGGMFGERKVWLVGRGKQLASNGAVFPEEELETHTIAEWKEEKKGLANMTQHSLISVSGLSCYCPHCLIGPWIRSLI